MALFKKKKTEEVKEEEKPTSSVEDVSLDKETHKKTEEAPKKLTKEEEALKQLVLSYKAYDQVFTPEDMARLPQIIKEAETFKLQLAIYAELKKLNEHFSKN